MTPRVIARYGLKVPQKLLSMAAKKAIGIITHVSTRAPVAALTFDDGPHPEYTPRLLEILDKHHARATFFMLGEAAQRQRTLVEHMAGIGHAVGNHSWNQPSFPQISERERQGQIRACQQALAPYGQQLFRPPYGEQSVASRLTPLKLGYKVIAWNVEIGDWWNPDAERMADLLVSGLKPGSVILLHDALVMHSSAHLVPKLTRQPHVNRESMLAALDMFLKRVDERFHFITVPELLRYGSPQRANWYRTTPPY
jgi:peptidoglycan/xylan/chitin deacetylase (PgdA/CDA1 family)